MCALWQGCRLLQLHEELGSRQTATAPTDWTVADLEKILRHMAGVDAEIREYLRKVPPDEPR